MICNEENLIANREKNCMLKIFLHVASNVLESGNHCCTTDKFDYLYIIWVIKYLIVNQVVMPIKIVLKGIISLFMEIFFFPG